MRSTRDLLNDRFADPSVQKNIDLDIQRINFYDEGIEWYIKKHAKINDYQTHIRKSLSILAHKLGRAIYFMLKRKQPFNMEKFLPA